MKELRLEFPDPLHPVHIDLRVKPGDRIRPGDLVALITTGKAEQELEAFEPGVIVAVLQTARGYVLQLDDLPHDKS